MVQEIVKEKWGIVGQELAEGAEARLIEALMVKRLRQVSDLLGMKVTKGQKVRLKEGKEAEEEFGGQRRANKVRKRRKGWRPSKIWKGR